MSVFDPLRTLSGRDHIGPVAPLARLGFVSIASLLGCTASQQNLQVREDLARRVEAFVEVFDQPARLEQVRRELSSRNWRVDCVGYSAARPFLRVQLPAGATYKNVEYVMHLPGRSAMRMVYETQPKEPCPEPQHR